MGTGFPTAAAGGKGFVVDAGAVNVIQ